MGSSAGPDIVASNRLVLNLDASDINSYPRSGTTWYDLSPYQNHGTLTNGPTHGYTHINGNHYIDFDGTNDYVDFGNDSSIIGLNDDDINTAQQFSFEVVIDAHTQDSAACVMGMGSFQSSTNEFNMNIGGADFNRFGGTVRLDTNNYRVYYSGTGDHTPINTTQGNYQHVVMTIDETNGMYIYVNSVLASDEQSANFSLSTIIGGHSFMSLGGNFRIGNLSFGAYVNASTFTLNGRIAIARVYNKSLTAAEIKQNFEVQRGRFNIV